MLDNEMLSLMERISARRTSLTPRARILADYVLQNSRKVIFMTIKQLASAFGVSESSVVRFVGQIGYQEYPHLWKSNQPNRLDQLPHQRTGQPGRKSTSRPSGKAGAGVPGKRHTL